VRTSILLALTLLAACAEAGEQAREMVPAQTGEASIYADKFEGRKTASGERFDQDKPTAAHPSLPLGSEAAVTNLETGQTTEVTVNDRGPHVKGRIIDLSEEAAEAIGLKDGTAPVKVEPQ
jgi:rare lipoprotein A